MRSRSTLLAVLCVGSLGVSVGLLGCGEGPKAAQASFGAAANFAVGRGPVSVAVGDFNRDGKRDVAVANGNSNNVSVLLGNGVGRFSAPANFAAGTGPFSVAVGDFNGDARQDLAVANANSDNVSIPSEYDSASGPAARSSRHKPYMARELTVEPLGVPARRPALPLKPPTPMQPVGSEHDRP